jgi:hypothetical protein
VGEDAKNLIKKSHCWQVGKALASLLVIKMVRGNMNRMMEIKYVFLRTKMGRYEKDLNMI